MSQFTLDPEPSPAQAGRVRSVTERLRNDIVLGTLEPGSRLKIKELQATYDIGANALREALTTLAADGLVELHEQRGFCVAPMSIGDLRDITRIRQALECLALEWSIAHADDDWEARIVGAYHMLAKVEAKLNEDPAKYGLEWEARNEAFHRALISQCRSPRLLYFRDTVYNQSRRYRLASLSQETISRDESFTEHRAILDAALARDAKRASRLLAAHIDKGANLIEAADKDA